MLNYTTLDFEIFPHSNLFGLISSEKNEYTYSIVDIKLYTKQYSLIPALDFEIQKRLNDGQIAKYPFERLIIKNIFIPAGAYEKQITVFNSYIPQRLFACLVDSKSFNENINLINLNPFEFKP